MQLTAKLTQVLPLETGIGRNGEWKKQNIIVETDGQYPKKICVSIWGDKINPALLQSGNLLTIDFDIESREFNGKWYTDVKAWKIEPSNEVSNMKMPEPSVNYAMPEPPPPPSASDFDDLPF
ncbi:MAG: DUF3127 domain-containing protein [Dysgonamonadaceae bacterium]|jgi:hypothetical protein|nr:DUF3127 domain-containing protein [Dysgonamonadaceae bacterium]